MNIQILFSQLCVEEAHAYSLEVSYLPKNIHHFNLLNASVALI